MTNNTTIEDLKQLMAGAMSKSVARDDEGEFPPLSDLLDFSGENKTDSVLKAAAEAAVKALDDAGYVIVKVGDYV